MIEGNELAKMQDRISGAKRKLGVILAVFLIILFALIVIFQECKNAHTRIFSFMVAVMLHQKGQTDELVQFGAAADEDETEYGQRELSHRYKYKEFRKTWFPLP